MTNIDRNSRGERLQVMLAADELNALDDFRFRERMPTRAAAVRELLRRGLAAEGFLALDGRAKSSDFGVLAAKAKQDGGKSDGGTSRRR